MSTTDDIDPLEHFTPRAFHPKPFRPDEIDPVKLVVSFDRRSDTLLIHLFGRGRESVSVPIANSLYLLVDPETEVIVGFHVEGFLGQAVKEMPESIDLLDYAELRGMTPAEVRELQREIPGARRRRHSHLLPNGKRMSVAEQRKEAVASFIDAKRSRRELSFMPLLA